MIIIYKHFNFCRFRASAYTTVDRLCAVFLYNMCIGTTWAQYRGKRQYDKKSQKCYISLISGEAPSGPIRPERCLVGDVQDVITCAKFQIEIFMGYDFTGGRIYNFPIDFCMGLTTVHR